MAYIESHQSLLNHRKTLRAVALLKLDKHKLIGHLHALWWWGLDNADKDGWLGDTFPEEITAASGFFPKRSDEWVNALVAVRFLDKEPDGFRFHNWALYTWRYYGMKKGTGVEGNHKRWHVDGKKPSTECPLCIAEGIVTDSGLDSVRN